MPIPPCRMGRALLRLSTFFPAGCFEVQRGRSPGCLCSSGGKLPSRLIPIPSGNVASEIDVSWLQAQEESIARAIDDEYNADRQSRHGLMVRYRSGLVLRH